MAELKSHSEFLQEVCYSIYLPNDEYELFGIEIRPDALPDDTDVSQVVILEGIQNQIIDELKSAKYTIWIAMAWFTDLALYNELLINKSQGVNIQIIIDDNEINGRAPFQLEDAFDTHWVSIQSLYKNIMHNKFCIIDLCTVVHGTYNWTRAAQYNKETISIDKTVKLLRDLRMSS